VNVETVNLDNGEKHENAVGTQTDDFEGTDVIFVIIKKSKQKNIYISSHCVILHIDFAFSIFQRK
jgi:hypothetical protein